jgi:hypothetical protein
MNWLSIRRAFVAIFFSVIAISGCQRSASEPSAAATDSAAASKASAPEAVFVQIVEEFRRGVEGEPIGFVVKDGAGRKTMMTGHNHVTHEMLPPKKDGDPLKAVIRVSSESRYSMQRTTESTDTESSNEPAEQPSNGQSAEGDVQIFDPSIASTPGQGAKSDAPANTADPKAVVVARDDNKDERSYELVYENGRWKLVTELDPNTEGLIKFAFERALATQG